MDLRSLNGGTVEDKKWLNPIVGTITSQTSQAGQYLLKDPVSGFPARQCGASFSYQTGIPIPIYTLTSGVYTDVTTQQVTGNYIPTSQLQVNNTFEIYMAGTFLEAASPSAGALQFYPAFVPISVGTQAITELLIPYDAVAATKSFEFRCRFRVIAFTDATITCQVSYSAAAETGGDSKFRVLTDPSIVPIPTASRGTNDIMALRVYATGNYSALTRYQFSIRQVS